MTRKLYSTIDLGSCTPSRQQELLLRAALFSGDEAMLAWSSWRAETNLEAIELASYQLLPLLYKNLLRHQVGDVGLDKLKGIYRRTWYRNQMLFHYAGELLTVFRQAGIETLLLKGVAMIIRYYHDYGLRPMIDFDVLIPAGKIDAAIHLLTEQGWRPLPHPYADAAKVIHCLSHKRIIHSYGFSNATKYELDLHRYLLHQGCYPGADDEFWQDALQIEWNHAAVYVLNPTDQLLHICVQGLRYSFSYLRWIADAIFLMRNAEIDWDRLLLQTEKRRLILYMQQALLYLAEKWHIPVPENVLHTLCALPVSMAEKIEYKVSLDPPSFRYRLVGYWRLAHEGDSKPVQISFTGLPRYLCDVW